jgi:hypothetical protein
MVLKGREKRELLRWFALKCGMNLDGVGFWGAADATGMY